MKNVQFEQIVLDGPLLLNVKGEFHFQDSRQDTKAEYILDPDKGFVCLERKVSMFNGPLISWDKSDGFVEITKGYWYPKSYTIKEFMPDFKRGEQKVKTYIKCDLISAQINVSIPESTFQIEFPSGTQVYDDIIKQNYVVP